MVKVLYICYENAFATGILNAMVLRPIELLLKRNEDLDITLVSILKKGDSSDFFYQKTKRQFLQRNKVTLLENEKSLGKRQAMFVLLFDIIRIIWSLRSADADVIHCRSYGATLIGFIVKLCFIGIIRI